MAENVYYEGYEAGAVAYLTLRINTPPGEWLSRDDLDVVNQFHHEAVARDGEALASEFEELAMLNLAWAILANLAVATGLSEQEWLQRIAPETFGIPTTEEK